MKISYYTKRILLWALITQINGTDGDLWPPPLLVVDIAVGVLRLSDVVLVSSDNNDSIILSIVASIRTFNIRAAIFHFGNESSSEEELQNLKAVISGGPGKSAIFFLDKKTTGIFFQIAPLVEDLFSSPCYYHWVLFDISDEERKRLQNKALSVTCWNVVEVRRSQPLGSTVDVECSIRGAFVTQNASCETGRMLAKWTSSKRLADVINIDVEDIDFRNRTFITSVTNEHPFYALGKDGKKYEGIEYNLLKTIRKRLNFRYKIVNKTDASWGTKLENGSWTGFIRMIKDKEITFAVSTLSITAMRMTAVDFTAPYLYDRLTFIVATPEMESRAFVLIKPFSIPMWVSLGVTFLMCTFILHLITHILPAKNGVRRAYNVWFLFRTLGQQGTTSPAPARYSIRFFVSSWWLFILVILWSYGGTLTSYMTYPGYRNAIDTLRKLEQELKRGTITCGTIGGTTYQYYLMNTLKESNPIYSTRLTEHPENFVDDVAVGLQRVLNQSFAFIYMKLGLKWQAAKFGYEKFRLSQNVFRSEAMAIAVQKCHPCKKSFDLIINRLEETGLIAKWYDDVFIRARIEAPLFTEHTAIRSLAVTDIQGALYFLIIGYAVAASFLTGEMVARTVARVEETKHRKKKKRQNQSYSKMIKKKIRKIF